MDSDLKIRIREIFQQRRKYIIVQLEDYCRDIKRYQTKNREGNHEYSF